VALLYISGGTVLTGMKDREQVHKMHLYVYMICDKHRYFLDGTVSRAEYGLKESVEKPKIEKLNKKIRNAVEKAKLQQNDHLKQTVDKVVTKALRGKGSKKDGIKYIQGIDPTKFSASDTPFVPSTAIVPVSHPKRPRPEDLDPEPLGKRMRRDALAKRTADDPVTRMRGLGAKSAADMLKRMLMSHNVF
jgi:hypothetical protein